MRALHCKTVCAASRAKESRRTDALFIDPLAEKLALPPQGTPAKQPATPWNTQNTPFKP